jgi:hypothetical protein
MIKLATPCGKNRCGQGQRCCRRRAAEELGQLGKSALQSKLVQDAAAGAVVDGVLASMIPIPILSTVTGATVGAALGVYKSIGKK